MIVTQKILRNIEKKIDPIASFVKMKVPNSTFKSARISFNRSLYLLSQPRNRGAHRVARVEM